MKVKVKAFARFREVFGKKVCVELRGVRYHYVRALYAKTRGLVALVQQL